MTREYMDEQFLKIKQEMEDERAQEAAEDIIKQEIADQDIAGGQATIFGEVVKFAPREFLDGKIRIIIPEEWTDMAANLVKLKYPYENRPPIILTDSTTAINLTVNHTIHALKCEDLEAFIKTMKMFAAKATKAQFIEDGLVEEEQSGLSIGFFDFTVPGFDEELYNFAFCTSLDNRALIITFNCLATQKERWKPIAFDIMKTLEVCKDDGLDGEQQEE